MKKFVIVAMSLLVCIGVLVGCTPAMSQLDTMKESVSYSQTGLMVGGNADVRVEIASGSREISMISDGVVSEMMEYCTLTITPLSYELYDKQMKFKLIGEKGEISGDCKRAIVGINQMADILQIESIGAVSKIVIMYAEVSVELELTSAMEGMIDYKAAVESVYNGCKTDVEPMFDGNEFLAEVHVKISRDNTSDIDKYYWYVSVTVDTETSLYVLVDGKSGAILAKKCSGD